MVEAIAGYLSSNLIGGKLCGSNLKSHEKTKVGCKSVRANMPYSTAYIGRINTDIRYKQYLVGQCIIGMYLLTHSTE